MSAAVMAGFVRGVQLSLCLVQLRSQQAIVCTFDRSLCCYRDHPREFCLHKCVLLSHTYHPAGSLVPVSDAGCVFGMYRPQHHSAPGAQGVCAARCCTGKSGPAQW
jgi:hypothetical protein